MSDIATIIIPQYEHHELTKSCLQTLREHDAQRWPVIVVDDGSPDEMPLDDFAGLPNVTLLRQPHRGVTSAWNTGWQAATTRWVIFLNNDVVSHGEWVARLLAPLENGTAEMTGVRFRREQFLPRGMLQRLPTKEFLEGWCLAIGRDTLEQLGGFDPRLITYWSDTDLQLRVVASSRRVSSLHAVPDLPLTHIGHATAHDPARLPRRRNRWQADRSRFVLKWNTRR